MGSGGVIYGRVTVPTATDAGRGAVEAQIERVTTILARAAESLTGRPAVAASLVAPGVIDAEAGIIHSSANIGWADGDMKKRIGRIIDAPFTLGHDVRAAALSEWKLGAARGIDDFLFVGLGTGIGAAIVAGGVIWTGRNDRAGQIGHIRAASDGQQCGCGMIGCLETIASASAISRRYLAQGGEHPRRPSAGDVLRWASDGRDGIAIDVRDQAVAALGSALMAVQGAIDVDLVVLGGGLSLAGDSLLVPLTAEMSRHSSYLAAPNVRLSAFGSDSGIRGAAVMAWRLLGVE